MKLVASCAFGLEAVVARELQSLGFETKISGPGQVNYDGDWQAIAKSNLWLRCADRVSIVIAEFPCDDFDTLFDATKAISWLEWVTPDGMIHVTGGSVKSQLSSVPAIQRTVKKAIVETLLSTGLEELPESGERFRIHISIRDDVARITLDTTGPSLHKRGYREISTKAPLKETMAAALVKLSFWRPDRPLIDPFCGGGTILIEAAMIGRNMAPGLKREFACESWPFMDEAIWPAERQAAEEAAIDSLPIRLIGNDIHGGALSLARRNAEIAGVANEIHFQQQAFDALTSSQEYGCVVMNPPYGDRLDPVEIRELYESIPLVLKNLPTWSHFILTAYPQFEKLIGKQANRRRKLYNGRIECTYFQFHGPRPNKRLELVAGEASEISQADTDTDTETETKTVAATDTAAPEKETLAQQTTESEQGEYVAQSKPDASESNQPSLQPPPTSNPPPKQTSNPSPKPATPPTSKSPSSRAATTAVFGEVTAKDREQAELFANRLKKRARHLRRWPTRRGITCFRLYERDIPEIPLVVDRYEDHIHIVEFERPHDRDLARHASWLDMMAATASATLDVPPENVIMKTRLRQKGLQQHEKMNDVGKEMIVHEAGLKFLVNLTDYTDTGLFLDHRAARSIVGPMCEGKRVLNLFAYTGAFSVYAAAAGAKQITTVDWSATYLDWARRNFRSNDLDDTKFRFIREDTREFVFGLLPAEQFDIVVCDPPTFSNSKRTEKDWDVQQHHAALLKRLLAHLAPGGTIFFSSNFRRLKLDEDALTGASIQEITKRTLPEDFRNQRIHRSWFIGHAS